MTTIPGEVWLADLGLAAKYRPVVIVSRAHSTRRVHWCCTCR